MTPHDELRELSFALAEGHVVEPGPAVRTRVLATALRERAAGRTSAPPPPVAGVEAFRRVLEHLRISLRGLKDGEWTRPSVRGLTVQQLVGHLIGVERIFVEKLQGRGADAARRDHVRATQELALGQADRPVAATLADWEAAADTTLSVLGAPGLDGTQEVGFFGILLPLEQLLVVRAFELWIHEEDIARAVGRPRQAPDDDVLARMTALAVGLLPAALSGTGRMQPGALVHLVLTGAAGGTWEVPLDGTAPHPPDGITDSSTAVVLQAADFCRVVGNRLDLDGAAASVEGDRALAGELFAAAAALALD